MELTCLCSLEVKRIAYVGDNCNPLTGIVTPKCVTGSETCQKTNDNCVIVGGGCCCAEIIGKTG